jgi:hypothetical protein
MDIEAIKRRLEAATPAPWEKEQEQIGKRSKPIILVWSKQHVVCRVGTVGMPNVEEDGDFIQHAPTDITALLETVQALRNELAALYALHDTAVADRDRYREALEPFARFREVYDKGYALQAQRDEDVVFAFSDATITLGDLRRAAEVLREDDGH